MKTVYVRMIAIVERERAGHICARMTPKCDVNCFAIV